MCGVTNYYGTQALDTALVLLDPGMGKLVTNAVMIYNVTKARMSEKCNAVYFLFYKEVLRDIVNWS